MNIVDTSDHIHLNTAPKVHPA